MGAKGHVSTSSLSGLIMTQGARFSLSNTLIENRLREIMAMNKDGAILPITLSSNKRPPINNNLIHLCPAIHMMTF